MEDSNQNSNSNSNSEVDRVIHLIDVTSEDDSLISSGDDFQVATQGALDSSKVPPPERTRKAGKCNLRKSLAWDSAFFTNAGVLEPEELSIINCGLNKAPLPGIQEDVRRSAESNSTLDSDNFTLENLEAGLFDDIRASIQMSSNASILTNSSSRDSLLEPEDNSPQSRQSSRKMELGSRNKMKPITMSKRQAINTQGAQSKKEEPVSTKKVAEKNKREASGTKKEALVRPHAQVTARSGELTQSLLRPPKIAGRINPISTSPTKRASLGANRVKTEIRNGKSASGRKEEAIGGSKRPVYGDSNVTPRSKSFRKSSSSSSVSGIKMESAASCSSHDKSGSTSSGSTDNSLTKKTNVATSTLKPPLRISLKDKTEVRTSAYIKSVSKLSPSISPASSQDGWSSESSSSTNQHPKSSPFKGLSSDRVVSQSHMLKSVDHKKGLPSPSPKRNTPGATADSKPTGLRMPSPKFGYFDAEKSTEAGGLRFHPGVRSGLPKHGAGARVKHDVKPQPATSKIGSGVRKSSTSSGQPLEVPTISSTTKSIPDMASLSEDFARAEITTTNMVVHDVGHSEKENSGCYENQVDIIDPKPDELTVRKHTTTSQFDTTHEDDSVSPDVPRMRTPLAVKCNETEDSSTMDKVVSTCTIIESGQKDNTAKIC
ncbi:hypothetical protein ACHQM5_009979 [Ranunculus cassubicifolius]